MKSSFGPATHTNYISFKEKNCTACWKCIYACPKNVIGKINLPWHKHAVLVHPFECTGCKRCISVCKYNAFTSFENISEREKTTPVQNLIKNTTLAITAIATIISGFILQIGFHMGNHSHRAIIKTIWSFDYHTWSDIHKLSSILFCLFSIWHIAIHLKWYKTVFSKRLFSGNLITVSLTILFIILAFSGITPWLLDTLNGDSLTRLILIESHDKIALFFTIFTITHIYRKKTWFINSLKNV